MEGTELVELPAHTWQLRAAQAEGSVAALPARGPADTGRALLCPSTPARPSTALLSSRKLPPASLTDRPLLFLSGSPLLPSLATPSLPKTSIWKREPHCGGLIRPWRTGPVRKTYQLHAPERSCFLGFYLDPSHLRSPFRSSVESGEP